MFPESAFLLPTVGDHAAAPEHAARRIEEGPHRKLVGSEKAPIKSVASVEGLGGVMESLFLPLGALLGLLEDEEGAAPGTATRSQPMSADVELIPFESALESEAAFGVEFSFGGEGCVVNLKLDAQRLWFLTVTIAGSREKARRWPTCNLDGSRWSGGPVRGEFGRERDSAERL